MDVRRQSGQNTVQVVEAVRAKLDSLRRALPPEVKVTVTRDDSQFIRASIASLEEHLLLGSLLASLVIMAVHPEHPGRGRRLAGDPGVDHRQLRADPRRRLHAEQHDAARRSRSPSAS